MWRSHVAGDQKCRGQSRTQVAQEKFPVRAVRGRLEHVNCAGLRRLPLFRKEPKNTDENLFQRFPKNYFTRHWISRRNFRCPALWQPEPLPRRRVHEPLEGPGWSTLE